MKRNNILPKISIITPNFNYAKYIGNTIQSIVDQKYTNWEHIIVDDGSTDNSVKIINQFVELYPDKIKLINQKNQGQTTAINQALKYVTGDVIGWINSDDFYCSGVFNEIGYLFSTKNKIDAIYGDIILIDSENNELFRNKYLSFSYISGVFNGFGRVIPSSGIFWKTALSKEIGLFNPIYEYAMDAEYWSRLLFNRYVIHRHIYIAKWRQHCDAKTHFRQIKNTEQYLIAQSENAAIARKSYQNLFISRLIPFKLSQPIKIYYQVRRRFFRFLLGHYAK